MKKEGTRKLINTKVIPRKPKITNRIQKKQGTKKIQKFIKNIEKLRVLTRLRIFFNK